ncbi:ATP-binding cassette (ABC) Superfamily [Phytophthora palmivora]|uniref:ATP-binding cassette (ABC) Superfamily n=1 Tax=Phytophthora palmivora TaxID=4796 RepID=A0A2P4YVI8_9STRA|nr:ATP-binding cassette (ABC) Superfamily [Phytophthora palmivora]
MVKLEPKTRRKLLTSGLKRLLLKRAQPPAPVIGGLPQSKAIVAGSMTPISKRRRICLNSERSLMLSMSNNSFIELLNAKASQRYHPLCLLSRCILADTIRQMRILGLQWIIVASTMIALLVAPTGVLGIRINRALPELLRPLGVCCLHHTEFFKEFASPWKKPEARGGLFPTLVGLLEEFTVQELKELREDHMLSYVLDQRDLRIVFAHLIA